MRESRNFRRLIRIAFVLAAAFLILIPGRKTVSAEEPGSRFVSETETVSVTEVKDAAGKFTVRVVPEESLDVKGVTVSVWSAEDRSDLYTYTAEEGEDKTFLAEVRVSKHQYHLGDYRIEAYGTLENGSRWFLGRSTQYFSPANFPVVRKTENPGERVITLYNVDSAVEKVTFAVWSKTEGQDDLIWNEAAKNEDGTWSVMIHTLDYLHDGRYYADAYVDGKYASGRSFKVDISEMGRNGWVYENGLKLYYVNDRLQTDVRDLVGGPYEIRINRYWNMVTIYSAQDEGDYIIPVVSFVCSVGLPDTPTPTGYFYAGEKYRWKTLMGPSYGQYVTHVYAGVYMHSVAGYNMSSYNLDPNAYNMLGSPASHGCIRLCVRDAKWIYENVPSGSLIYIYDSEDPGPFPKPELPKIPPEQNWDPTDPEA